MHYQTIFKIMRDNQCFAARTNDETVLSVSSSGGVFTELARVVLADGGVVFGAGWQSHPLRVVHKWIEDESELDDLRGSKYAVSDMTGVYAPLRRFLEDGRKVLFVGMPCQTAAVRKVFGERPNLVLCALICMANAEPSMLKSYVKELEVEHGSRVRSIRLNASRRSCVGPCRLQRLTSWPPFANIR